MTWGKSPYGLSPWGAVQPQGSLTLVFVERAEATADRVVLVTMSNPPLLGSPSLAGAALNPSSWQVTNLATGEMLTVLAVIQVSPTQFELHLLQVLGPVDETHELEAIGLLTPGMEPISPPTTAQFQGMSAASQPGVDDAAIVAQDLDNPQVDRLDRTGGTLRVGSDGDYVNDSGVVFLRKLVIRRLMTLQGAFFHLTDYGTGLRLKEPLPVSDLVKLRAAIELAVQREPEIRSVRTRVSLSNDGILLVQVRAVMEPSGELLSAGVEVAPPILT